ncbi:hypothetical protein K8B33_01710 [Alcanivorax sp. JB21]|uniref:toxin-antitoxin system YwqK family antitoxin n=1 Tax=Alcanivorax limicola TaxID=2874102 RepID=UPI001CBE04F1|nr:hypothetical protein [Alcanivorax limicola]MBZ2187803.1 hypothetical protein [Alcanivorax limicola]
MMPPARLLMLLSLLCCPAAAIADEPAPAEGLHTEARRIWLNDAMQPAEGADTRAYYTDIPYPAVDNDDASSAPRFQQHIHYADGNLFRENQSTAPDLSGTSDGPFRHFAPDGTLLAEGQRRMARLHGTVRRYNSDGALRAELNYHMGQAHGLHRNFHPETGALASEIAYEHGQVVDGTYDIRDAQGRLERRYTRRDGQLHGASEYFHEGVLVRRQHYEAGQRHGLYESFHNDGTPRDRYTLVNGQRRGESQSWHANGELRVQQYINDDGDMTFQETFRDDGTPSQAMRVIPFSDGSTLHVSRRFSAQGTPSHIDAEHKLPDGETLASVQWQQRSDGLTHTRTQLLTPHKDIHALRIIMHQSDDGSAGDYQRDIRAEANTRWLRDGPQRETTFQGWVSESHYVHGALHGAYQLRDDNGVILSRGEYQHDQREGPWIEREHFDGLITHKTYRNGKRHGEYRIEAEQDDGTFQVREIGHHQDGLRHGNVKRFNAEGELISDVAYDKDMLHGSFFDTDRDGNVHRTDYLQGKQHGPYRREQPAGYPLEIGQYRNGLPEGRFYRFSREGRLFAVTDYEEGEPVGSYYPE